MERGLTWLFVLTLLGVTLGFVTPEWLLLLSEPPEGLEIFFAFFLGVLHFNCLLSFSLVAFPSKQMPLWLKYPVLLVTILYGLISALLSLQGSYILTVVVLTISFVMVKQTVTNQSYLRTAIWILAGITMISVLFLVWFFRF